MKTVGALTAALLVAWAPRAEAACPSYTPAETAAGQRCGVEPAPGANPAVAEWKPIFGMVAGGKAAWGTNGPDIPTMGAGCGKPVPKHTVDAHFPCHVLMAIAMQESGWKQFCVPDAPAASVGAPERTIVSFDCGYGVGQVTSGMHVGESPAFDRARVASDPSYNLATGSLILREKWAATNCVGDNDPDIVEDWYVALWAYNGLAYSNNPNNPNLTANRGPYDPRKGGSYTYQERVLGWMEHPPDAAHWPALAPAYPNRGDIPGTGAPPDLPEPSCASPTSCATTRGTHRSACDTVQEGDGGVITPDDAGAAPPDAGSGGGAGTSGGCSCRAGAGAEGAPESGAWWIAVTVVARRSRREARVKPPGAAKCTPCSAWP
jgi:hypothetical protein